MHCLKNNNISYIIIFFILLPITIYSQSNIGDEKRKKFYELKNEYEYSENFSNHIGDKLLNLAQTDFEKSLAYIIIGENFYNQSDYLSSVENLEKSLNFVNKTDSLDFKVRVLNALVMSYRRAGLIAESVQHWNDLKDILKKSKSKDAEANLLYTQTKIYDIDGKYCEAAITRRKYYDLTKDKDPVEEINNRFNFAILNQLVYELIKCGKINEAKITLNESDSLLRNIKSENPILTYDFYLMNKAFLSKFQGNTEDAIAYFDEALAFNAMDNNKNVRKVLLTERVDLDIDSPDLKIDFLKEINNLESNITKELTLKETEKKIKTLKNKQKSNTILIIGSIILLIVILFLIFYTIKNYKKTKNKYGIILEEIKNDSSLYNEKENNIIAQNIIESDGNSSDHNIDTIDILECDILKNKHKTASIISKEAEKEIVKNLEVFERKKQFTSQGLSATQMAASLKTNTKYLSFILKKYRGNDFYNYLNEMRINYIVKALYEDPKLLKYKISVLSDMCGYNTHSQFASAFKQIKDITPSQFITNLKNEKRL